VRQEHLVKSRLRADEDCRGEVVKYQAWRFARADIQIRGIAARLADAPADAPASNHLKRRICDLEEEKHAVLSTDPFDTGREMSVARAERIAGLRQEKIDRVEKQLAAKPAGDAKSALECQLEAAIGPDRLEVSREKATAEARRVRGWTVETPPFVVLSPARVDLHAHLDAVVRAARAEIMRSR